MFRNVNISNVGTDIRALNWEDPVMENVTINGKTYPRPVETKILGVPVPGQRIEGSSTLLGGEDTDLSSKWLISDSADGDYHSSASAAAMRFPLIWPESTSSSFPPIGAAIRTPASPTRCCGAPRSPVHQ